jgi:large subunit ribosomal protein L30
MSDKTVKVTLYKSPIGYRKEARATVRGLGLRRMHQTVELKDTPEVRGMIRAVAFLVRADS